MLGNTTANLCARFARRHRTFKAFVAEGQGLALQERDWQQPDLAAQDVEIDIAVSGLCHTDKHMIDNDWGVSRWPMVPGHEGVGKVSKVGAAVTSVKVGDRVGIAWMRGSCGSCSPCARGHQNLCRTGYELALTSVFNTPSHAGCFAKKATAHQNFVFPIPEALSDVDAAPLLCAGITVYTPLRDHITVPGMRVGVIGIGGLGHMALRFASKMGAEVTAFSSTASKKAEAFGHGAHHFVHTGNAQQMKAAKDSMDLIINCAPNHLDFTPYLGDGWPSGILSNGGKFVIVGLPKAAEHNLNKIPIIPLVFGHKQIIGSVIGGGSYMKDMLTFCAAQKIVPQVEEWKFSDINAAIKHVVDNKARYRVVLKY